MGSFTIAIDIARDPHTVFMYLADVATMPRWYEAVQHVQPMTPQTAGVGARYEMTRDLPGGRFQNEVVVIEYEPDQVFTIENGAEPTPFRYRYTLEPKDGGTRLHLDGRITGAGLPGPIAHIDALATQAFKRGMGENLRQLRRLIEAS